MKRAGQVWEMGKFRLRLYLVALFLAIIPTITSYFAVRGVLSSTLTLGFDQRIETQLEMAGKNLKSLARLDPANESFYKQQFLQLQETTRTYTFLLDTLPSMHRFYIIAFIIALAVGLISALLLATWLNRKIIQSHELALEQMKASQDRVLYLENQESWRLVAQKLVHEIKNPLTPIQVMVARLPGKYLALHSNDRVHSDKNLDQVLKQSHHIEFSQDFKLTLDETKQIVTEEIQKVNAWIEAFSKYARMPTPKLSLVNLNAFLLDFQRIYDSHWNHLKISLKLNESSHLKGQANNQTIGDPNCAFDPMLIKQVLFNLAKNSAEAVTEKNIEFSVEIQHNEKHGVTLVVRDNGPGLPERVKKHLFQPYISSKGTEQPRGFGLAIVKKILIEHGGDIRYLELPVGCGFEIFIPHVHYKVEGIV